MEESILSIVQRAQPCSLPEITCHLCRQLGSRWETVQKKLSQMVKTKMIENKQGLYYSTCNN